MVQRIVRKHRLTSDEVAHDRAVRDQFARHPSKKTLIATDEYIGPMSVDEYLEWRRGKSSPPLTKQLQAALKACNKTIYAIAQESGVSAPIIQRFLSGERGITLETAGKLATYLGLSLLPHPTNK
jgi:antitoxin component HigA of HigAB toxin-antitoxin module